MPAECAEKTTAAKLRSTSVCVPECEGRCKQCPDDLMREAADKLDALEAKVAKLEEEKLALLGQVLSGTNATASAAHKPGYPA